MNNLVITVILLIAIFVFIIYLIFSAQGINIFAETYNYIIGVGTSIFRDLFYATVAMGLLAVVLVAFVLFKFSAGK